MPTTDSDSLPGPILALIVKITAVLTPFSLQPSPESESGWEGECLILKVGKPEGFHGVMVITLDSESGETPRAETCSGQVIRVTGKLKDPV